MKFKVKPELFYLKQMPAFADLILDRHLEEFTDRVLDPRKIIIEC
jgi:hypothetical protein